MNKKVLLLSLCILGISIIIIYFNHKITQKIDAITLEQENTSVGVKEADSQAVGRLRSSRKLPEDDIRQTEQRVTDDLAGQGAPESRIILVN